MDKTYGLPLFIKCIFKSYFNSKNSAARLSFKRFIIITITILAIFLVTSIHNIFLFIDEILFFSFKKIKINKPLFIVGIPRSGTTFLHRTLSQDSDKFTTFQLWEFLLAPSITQKLLLRGFFVKNNKKSLLGSLINKLQDKITKKLDKMHVSRLDSPEEDFLSLTNIFASFILVTPFPHIEEIWDLGYFDEKISEKNKSKIMNYYKKCLQRHLFVFGKNKRILSKNPSFTPKIKALKSYFPDCSIIACIRDPLETVPSQISTMIEAGKIFNNNNSNQFYQEKFSNLLKFYYEHIIKNITNDNQSHCIVPMKELQENVKKTVEYIYKTINEPMDKNFAATLDDIYNKSKNYKSKHKYSLKQFGLNEEKIKNEFSETYKLLNFNSLENSTYC
mgnify:CR=1 FL=1